MTPMLDAEGRPAIDVQLIRLEFDNPNRAVVGLHLGAGARWGTGTDCTLGRRTDVMWEVEDCRAIVHR
jgi:hypothetical protein